MGTDARRNPQVTHGGDVISRINFCNQKEGNLQILQSLVIGCFNEIIDNFVEKFEVPKEEINIITAVGNTTMSHLLLGVDPKSLAEAPFDPGFTGEVRGKAVSLGIDVNEDCDFYVMPNIAGHVGSDITAGILALALDSKEGLNVFVDIGTNGEIVLSNNGKLTACSTAAGPAFEGATIYQGMRATVGAIEKVSYIDGDIALKIIGSNKPIGICGSGLLDAVSLMVKEGIVTGSGKILDAEDARNKGVDESLVKRMIKDEKGKAFVLAYREKEAPIVITQKDVREVQLAKSAIVSGVMTLVKMAGYGIEDIDSIFLAGAFGNYIDKESAVSIGLLPDIAIEKIKSVGNSAGVGSSMALLAEKERNHALETVQNTGHIELASSEIFYDFYVNQMNFLHL